jgi:hypothetical protein
MDDENTESLSWMSDRVESRAAAQTALSVTTERGAVAGSWGMRVSRMYEYSDSAKYG